MKRSLCLIMLFAVLLLLCACSDSTGISETTAVTVPETTVCVTTEPAVAVDPAWFSDDVITEAVSYLFPLEGEKNVALAQELLLPLVESGNPEALYYWGYIYDFELVDNKGECEKESLYWYELAAEQGVPKAYLGVALNAYASEDEATTMIEEASNAGFFDLSPEDLGADGCWWLGSYYSDNQDYESAMEWLLKAAEMGNTTAMLRIGTMYYYGTGIKQDYKVSTDWLLKAAELGDISAMHWFGYVSSREEVVDKLLDLKYRTDLEKYRQAADEGDAVAMHNIGYMYSMGLGGLGWSDSAAMNWFKKAADLGDANAICEIGYMYQFGLGVPTDYEMAMKYFLKAADLGVSKAMSQLGYMYQEGMGVEPDNSTSMEWYGRASNCQKNDGKHIDFFFDKDQIYATAMDWYQKAAKAGHAVAMNNIGYMYEEGLGVFPDYNTARQWYQKGADAGAAIAMCNMGYLCKNGNGVTQDYDTAMEWFIKAYSNGYDSAGDAINKLLAQNQGVSTYFEHYGELISTNP